MGIIDRIKSRFLPKDESSPAFRREMAKKLDGRHIKYVTVRVEGVEEIIGREGHINILPCGDEVAVVCGIESKFRGKIDDTAMWELLSLEGVVITGVDLDTGEEKSITAYYKYYR